jgi:hypothetical protein
MIVNFLKFGLFMQIVYSGYRKMFYEIRNGSNQAFFQVKCNAIKLKVSVLS